MTPREFPSNTPSSPSDEPDAAPFLSAPGASPVGERPVCRLTRGIGRRAERGHLWVFSNEIAEFSRQPDDGDEVVVRSSRGRLLGTGLYSRAALIAVRLYSRAVEPFDAALLRRRLARAIEHRRLLVGDGSHPEVCRLCFGEGDWLPGLVVDRYGDHVVFQILTAGMERRRDLVVAVLSELLSPRCLFERSDVPVRQYEGLAPRVGPALGTPDPELSVVVDGLRLRVDIEKGQKTGLYLDQVANWRRGGDWARGRRVLDCFCHQGGWSLWAARGGARECLGIDSSQAAIGAATHDAVRNGLDGLCRFERADAFEKLRALETAGERFGMIVLDPPPFARNRKQVKDAERGYRELNVRALRLLAPDGVLFTCSCSYHIAPETFDEILVLAARDAGRTVRLLPGPGQPPDHPVLLATPETLYLKVRALEAME